MTAVTLSTAKPVTWCHCCFNVTACVAPRIFWTCWGRWTLRETTAVVVYHLCNSLENSVCSNGDVLCWTSPQFGCHKCNKNSALAISKLFSQYRVYLCFLQHRLVQAQLYRICWLKTSSVMAATWYNHLQRRSFMGVRNLFCWIKTVHLQ